MPDTLANSATALIVAGLAGFVAILFAHRVFSDLRLMNPLRWLFGITEQVSLLVLGGPTGSLAIAISIGLHALDVLMVFVIAWVLGIPLDLTTNMILVPPALLVAAIPISVAGWGVRESALVIALGFAGIAAEDAIVLSLFYGLTHLSAGLVGSAVWLLSGERKTLSLSG